MIPEKHRAVLATWLGEIYTRISYSRDIIQQCRLIAKSIIASQFIISGGETTYRLQAKPAGVHISLHWVRKSGKNGFFQVELGEAGEV